MAAHENELILFFIILPLLFTRLLITPLENLLCCNNLVCQNYEKKVIPQGMGILFFIVLIPPALVGSLLFTPSNILKIQFYLALGFAFFGFLDDTLGDKKQKGFKGHYKELLTKKKLTSGILKSILIILYVFITLLFLHNKDVILVADTILIAGMANLFNLFDVRPGRAWKLFYFIFFFILLFSREPQVLILFFPLLVAGLIYLPHEFSKRFVMGDTGSNILGGMMGFLIMFTAGPNLKLYIITLLLFIHLYCEKKSLTNLIEDNYILNFIDKLGLKNN